MPNFLTYLTVHAKTQSFNDWILDVGKFTKKRRIADSAQFFDLFCTLRKGSELSKFAKKRRIVDSAQILYSVLQ